MRYWESHWDWECPTLFGIELEELKAARVACLTEENEELVSYAALGCLRELLHGASAIPKNSVPLTIGISYEAACELCNQVLLLVDDEA